MADLALSFCSTLRGHKIAILQRRLSGASTTILYCPGLLSSARGRKGEYVAAAAQELGCSYAALEYGGQGRSEGSFLDFTLKAWIDDVIHVMDVVTPGAGYILVGSSLGAWLALHAALRRRHAVQGLLLVSPAVDITPHWQAVGVAGEGGAQGGPRLSCGGPAGDPQKDPQKDPGRSPQPHPAAAAELITIPSNYLQGGGFLLRRSFLEEANEGCLLLSGSRAGGGSPLHSLQCPVHILYSEQDDAVPPHLPRQLAQDLAHARCAYMELEAVQGGDHRLSRESDLQTLGAALRRMHRHVTHPC